MPSRALISLILKVSGNVNADMGVGTRIPLKKIITWNHEIKPFVSARCIRRCIRERLSEKGFDIDPLQMMPSKGQRAAGEKKQQLIDIGNPVKYVDDDIFGFFRPQERQPIKRSSPIKISHLVALRHAEIKVEFAARFPRDFLTEYEHGYPEPFEIELAEWLGKLNVIVSDRVGRFSDDELTEELKKELGNRMMLDEGEREKRLRGFLEVLLWEGWTFPRGAQGPSVPEYYYAIIGLTKRFAPIFGHVDVTEEGKLDDSSLEKIRKMYGWLLDKLYVLDYKGGCYIEYRYIRAEGKEEVTEERVEGSLNSESIRGIISDVCKYVLGTTK
ncbi:MAG: type I-B CRISPR-associated protein Cas7/Cst2/DevR [Crenarchaeota archaeon]|nr:type I-B CRISPR-associated protein Cas7/Cst2/DevR [Thermoproteota archaeon]